MHPDTTDLYRYFDAEGRLLYVGISFSAVARASQHRTDKGWWSDVATMTVERHPDRKTAEDAERQAIVDERPLHNVIHNGKTSAAKLERQMRASPVGMAKARRNVESDNFTLVDYYFLTPADDGEFPRVGRQGRVVGEVAPGFYVIQLYSWWDGEPSSREVVEMCDMRGWKFYTEHADWLRAGEIGMRANDLHAERMLSA